MVGATVGYALSKGRVRQPMLQSTGERCDPVSDGDDTASNRDAVWPRQLPRPQCGPRLREPRRSPDKGIAAYPGREAPGGSYQVAIAETVAVPSRWPLTPLRPPRRSLGPGLPVGPHTTARRGLPPVPQRPEPQRARRGGRTSALRSLAKDAEARRELVRPASNAASRDSISLSHAASTDSSSSSGRRETRSRRTNSCRSAGGRAIAFCNRLSTRLAMASPLRLRLQCESANSTGDFGCPSIPVLMCGDTIISGKAKSTTASAADCCDCWPGEQAP